MVFLRILFGIVLFIALLCALPLRLRITLEENFMLRAGLGALTLFRIPKEQKPVDLKDFTYKKHQKRLAREKAARLKKQQKAKQKAEKKEQKKNAAKEAKNQAKSKAKEIADTAEAASQKENKLEGILDIVSCVLGALPPFFGGFKFQIYRLDITAGGKKAADVAKNFGILSQSLAYLLEFLDNKTRFVKPKEDTIAIRADFLAEKTVVKADFYLQLRVGQIFSLVFRIIGSYIKTLL